MAIFTIVNIIHSAAAFGRLEDNGQNVYIPARVSEHFKLTIGQRVDGQLTENTQVPDRTPWVCYRITALLTGDELADAIRDDLERGPATAKELADSIGQPLETVENKLRWMARNSSLERATLYALRASDFDTVDGE